MIPERLEAVDVRGEVLRPGLGEDGPGCPQHPVGLEGLLQVLGQAAAVVDDGTELLHLCQGPPVHVGTAHVDVPSIHHPELGVQNAASEPSHGHVSHLGASAFQDLQVSGVLGRSWGAGGHGQGHVSVQQLLQLLQEGLARLGRRVVDPDVGPREGPVEGGHVDALSGGVQQLHPGLGQGLGGRAACCRSQVLGNALHEDEPAGVLLPMPPPGLPSSRIPVHTGAKAPRPGGPFL